MKKEDYMKTLKSFPEDFLPLVVVTGDRREVPPQSQGDLLAYSVSNTDFMYLNYLNIPNVIVQSDKQFVIENEDVLRKRFGETNILVIGSPAVNLLARRINDQSIYRFSVSEETKAELEEQNDFINKYIETDDDRFIYYQCLEGLVKIDSILARNVGLDPHIDELRLRAEKIVPEFMKTRICADLQANPRPIRNLMHKLDKPGIFDSMAKINRGEAIPASKDYGLISILRNPFSESDDYYIIYVAGVHGPGTALGVKLLSEKNAFKDHPFGGIYEVNIDRFAEFFEKFQKSRAKWETRPYEEQGNSPDEIIRKGHKIKVFLSSPAGKDDGLQQQFNKRLKSNLNDTCKRMGIDLLIEDAYSLPLGGRNDFWDAILDYEKDCNFILHDVTNTARGVMVEIGFSIGKRKQHYLFWNSEKSTKTDWAEMHIPSLLPTANIDQIDLRTSRASKESIKKKVVEKAISNLNIPNCNLCESLSRNSNRRSAFVYARESALLKYLDKELTDRRIYRVSEEESIEAKRICKICQVLRISDMAFVEVSNKDLNSLIILGMSKAIGVRTLPISLDVYNEKNFPWAQESITYQVDLIPERLNSPVAKFIGQN
jgi:hypothetical protein